VEAMDDCVVFVPDAQCHAESAMNSTEVRIAQLLEDLRAHLEMVEGLHESMRRAIDASAAEEAAARQAVHPAPSEVLEAINLVCLDCSVLRSLRQAAQCVICCADWEAGEELARLPGCGHLFHPGCVREWLSHAGNCPICRCDLKEAVVDAEPCPAAASSSVATEAARLPLQMPPPRTASSGGGPTSTARQSIMEAAAPVTWHR